MDDTEYLHLRKIEVFIDKNIASYEMQRISKLAIKEVTKDEKNGQYTYKVKTEKFTKALEKIFGNKIKFGTGPAIENGFYYDVFFEDKDIKFDQKYYEIIEKTFLEIASRDDIFEKKNISKNEAINFFEEKGNKSKSQFY